jgi:sulfonate transport system permease protein
MFVHVLFPAALPQVFIGLRIATGVAVLVIIATEFLVGDSGLGFLIFDSQRLFLTAPMYVGIVCSALLGVLFTAVITWIGRKACPWAPRGDDIQPR